MIIERAENSIDDSIFVECNEFAIYIPRTIILNCIDC